jgi:hypothetical protein
MAIRLPSKNNKRRGPIRKVSTAASHVQAWWRKKQHVAPANDRCPITLVALSEVKKVHTIVNPRGVAHAFDAHALGKYFLSDMAPRTNPLTREPLNQVQIKKVLIAGREATPMSETIEFSRTRIRERLELLRVSEQEGTDAMMHVADIGQWQNETTAEDIVMYNDEMIDISELSWAGNRFEPDDIRPFALNSHFKAICVAALFVVNENERESRDVMLAIWLHNRDRAARALAGPGVARDPHLVFCINMFWRIAVDFVEAYAPYGFTSGNPIHAFLVFPTPAPASASEPEGRQVAEVEHWPLIGYSWEDVYEYNIAFDLVIPHYNFSLLLFEGSGTDMLLARGWRKVHSFSHGRVEMTPLDTGVAAGADSDLEY